MTATTTTVTTRTAAQERKQARKERWRQLRRRPAFIVGALILLFWTFCALFGEWFVPHDPGKTTPETKLSPRADHLFGTDKVGRDIFSRVIVGARDIFSTAPAAALIGVAAGVIVGLFIGYFGGWLDLAVSRVIEAILALPLVLIALLAITSLGSSKAVVIGTVAFLFTPIVARTVRAAVLAERDLDYVTSAKLRGESRTFIMFREILPNISGPIIVELTVRIGYAVFTVATLAFFGAGPQKGSPDWGLQVADGFRDMLSGKWWYAMFPALAIASLVIAVSLVADSVQSVLEN